MHLNQEMSGKVITIGYNHINSSEALSRALDPLDESVFASNIECRAHGAGGISLSERRIEVIILSIGDGPGTVGYICFLLEEFMRHCLSHTPRTS